MWGKVSHPWQAADALRARGSGACGRGSFSWRALGAVARAGCPIDKNEGIVSMRFSCGCASTAGFGTRVGW